GRAVRHVRARAFSAPTPLALGAGVAVVAGGRIGVPGGAGAHAGLAAVVRRAAGAVVARRAVRLAGVGAGAVAVAGARLVALVGRRAGERRAAAGPRRADVVLGARVAVVAGRAVRLDGVGAGAVAVAGAGLVALVGRRAREGRAAAGPRRADVVLGARGSVEARRAVRVGGVGAGAVAVAGAGLVALVGRRTGEGRAIAGAGRADDVLGAGVAVVARRPVRLAGVGAGAVAVAGAGLVALVGRRAGEGRAAAGPRRADVVLGARGAVVARRPVWLVGVGAGAGPVAGAGLVALVGRRTGEGRARARAGRADVILGARGAVVAGRPVRLVGVGAGAVAVAGAGLVALVGRRAGEGRARADLGRADVGLRAEVAVVARCAVARRHPDAPPGRAAVVRRAGVAVGTGRPLERLLPAALPHHTAALRAAVPRRAVVAVVARRALRLAGAGAGAVAVPGARPVALVGRPAGEGRAAAGPRRADVVLGARGAVVAGRAVRLAGVGAGAVAVAGARL